MAVVDAKGRRVAHQDIKRLSGSQAVQQQRRRHAQRRVHIWKSVY